MSITFDHEITPNLIFKYKDSTGVYSSNLSASPTHDYFDDDLAVGDIFYVGIDVAYEYGSIPFHNVKFFVGTPLVADSITLVWEYHNNGVWEVIPDLIDDTTNFTVAGENWVTFPVPPNWGVSSSGIAGTFYINSTHPLNVNSRNAIWIRCRVTAVTNPTEGGAQSTQVIKIKDYSIDVANEASATMTSIYNASDDGGWGVVTRDNRDFIINCNLKFTGTTSFTSIVEYIRVGSEDWAWIFSSMSATASVQFGLKDASGFGIAGSTFVYYTRGYTRGTTGLIYNLKAYGTKFWNAGVGYAGFGWAGDIDIVDCIVDTNFLYFGGLINVGSVLRRVLFDFTGFWYLYTGNLTIDAVSISKNCDGILSGVGNNVIENIAFDANQQVRRYYGSKVTMKNCTGIVNANIINALPSGVLDLWVKKQFTFDLTVIDNNGVGIESVSVKFVDGLGNVIDTVSTDGDGVIVQQTLTVYQKLWAYPDWGVTETDYNPFTVTITKSGYITKKIIYTMDQKRVDVEGLESRREV